jgi:hypothetical protein
VKPPDSVPDKTEHDEEEKRLDGTAVRTHVTPK